MILISFITHYTTSCFFALMALDVVLSLVTEAIAFKKALAALNQRVLAQSQHI